MRRNKELGHRHLADLRKNKLLHHTHTKYITCIIMFLGDQTIIGECKFYSTGK